MLVDDDPNSRISVGRFLRQLDHDVSEFENARDALAAFSRMDFPMVLSDIRMPCMSGLELLRAIQALPNGWKTDVVLFTGYGDMESSIEALRQGAYDYLLKPVDAEELASITQRIAEHQALVRNDAQMRERSTRATTASSGVSNKERNRLKKRSAGSTRGGGIGIFSTSMRKVLDLARRYHADRSLPVLIEGETGTGKEIVARFIHSGSWESDEDLPFVDINCATFNANLFESELFGYEPGAFTGGLCKGQKGKLDRACGGTLFLDELEELPLELQGKLLRVIQEKEFYRVGGLDKIQVDVRFIGATNVSLSERVCNGCFRKDLYFRVKVGHIIIPPLRERLDDILPLALLFLSLFSSQKKKAFQTIGKSAADLLLAHKWPGNVRELRNVIEWAVSMHDDVEMKPGHLEILDSPLLNTGTTSQESAAPRGWEDFELPKRRLPYDEFCQNVVVKALRMHHGNKAKTAEYLGISRQNLYTILKKGQSES